MSGKIRCSHILVEKLSVAQEILEKINKGESFSKMAEQYSTDGSRRRGGDLGEFGKGMMVRPFEEAAFKLQVGEVSPIVKTEFGYHIIKRTA
jgi:parvulin-like peptidyl-prolyl isomerase